MVQAWLDRIVVATEAKLAHDGDGDGSSGAPWSEGAVPNAWF